MRNRLAVVPLSVALAVALAACGDAGAEPTGTDDPPGSSDVQHPTDEDQFVALLQSGGGLLSPEAAFAIPPRLALLGDGTTLMARADDSERYHPLGVGHLGEAEVDRLLADAGEHGLLASEPDYSDGIPPVTDGPTTTLALVADGGSWTHSAYALGLASDSEETGARARLLTFVDELSDVVDGLETDAYVPTTLRLRVEDAAASTATEQESTPWPVDGVDLAEVGTCGVVTGAEARAVHEALSDPSLNRWSASAVQDGRAYSVTAAVVVPGTGRPCDPWTY